jgi:hypothetical protein
VGIARKQRRILGAEPVERGRIPHEALRIVDQQFIARHTAAARDQIDWLSRDRIEDEPLRRCTSVQVVKCNLSAAFGLEDGLVKKGLVEDLWAVEVGRENHVVVRSLFPCDDLGARSFYAEVGEEPGELLGRKPA